MSSRLTDGNEGRDRSQEIIEPSNDVMIAGAGGAGLRAAPGLAAWIADDRALGIEVDDVLALQGSLRSAIAPRAPEVRRILG
jgi:hypothetical protein